MPYLANDSRFEYHSFNMKKNIKSEKCIFKIEIVISLWLTSKRQMPYLANDFRFGYYSFNMKKIIISTSTMFSLLRWPNVCIHMMEKKLERSTFGFYE